MPLKDGLNQFGIQADVGLLKVSHHGRQINQPAKGSLFDQPQRSHHGQAALRGGPPPGQIIHQHGGGMNFLREADGLQFAAVHIQTGLQMFRTFDGHPFRQGIRPLPGWRRCVGLLQFGKNCGRDDHLLEEFRQDFYRTAQNQVVQRRSVSRHHADRKSVV